TIPTTPTSAAICLVIRSCSSRALTAPSRSGPHYGPIGGVGAVCAQTGARSRRRAKTGAFGASAPAHRRDFSRRLRISQEEPMQTNRMTRAAAAAAVSFALVAAACAQAVSQDDAMEIAGDVSERWTGAFDSNDAAALAALYAEDA